MTLAGRSLVGLPVAVDANSLGLEKSSRVEPDQPSYEAGHECKTLAAVPQTLADSTLADVHVVVVDGRSLGLDDSSRVELGQPSHKAFLLQQDPVVAVRCRFDTLHKAYYKCMSLGPVSQKPADSSLVGVLAAVDVDSLGLDKSSAAEFAQPNCGCAAQHKPLSLVPHPSKVKLNTGKCLSSLFLGATFV